MPDASPTPEQLKLENENLRSRLSEAQETPQAILDGKVDALVVPSDQGERLFTLKGAESIYRTLIEDLNEGAVTLTSPGVILYSNRRFAEMVKAPLRQVIGQPIHPWISSADREAFEALLGSNDVPSRRGEIGLCAEDGTLVPAYLSVSVLAAENSPAAFCLVATDLTEQKRSEGVVAAEKLARAILEQAGEAIVVCDAGGVVIRANAKAQALCGDSPLGRSFDAVFPLSLADGSALTLSAVLGSERLQGLEARREQEGQITHLLITTGPLPGAHDKKFGFVITLTDITPLKRMQERTLLVQAELRRLLEEANQSRRALLSVVEDQQQAEQALRKSETQLRQAAKMEAIGRLAGGVAHDFNNLLTIINGYTQLLLDRCDEKSVAHSHLEEVLKAGQRAAALTRQLLAFSRRQVLAPEVLDLNDVIQNTGKMLRRLIGEDIELVVAPHSGLGRARADPGQIEQVLMNLVVNARDAMPQGGKLTIETANVDLDRAYAETHPLASSGPHVMLAVSDTGCGMDRETLNHIFEPFFTTKEQGKGTGLGLATVYGIVKQSGGNIWVYSEPGEGTTFKIYLPRVQETASTTAAQQTRQPSQRGSETVLVVEDDQAVRPLVRGILLSHGYTVLEAGRADEALAVAENHRGPLALLVTDIVMPVMTGRALAEQLLLRHPETKVLYMSGHTDDAIVHHGVLEEGAAFLQKPFTPDSLTRKVREILDAPYPARQQPTQNIEGSKQKAEGSS